MKVLFIADVSLKNPSSGAEQVLLQQAKGLVREGMEVYAITRHTDPPPFIIRKLFDVKEGCYCVSMKNLVNFLLPLAIYPRQFFNCFLKGNAFQTAICHQPFNTFSLLTMRKLQHIPIVYVFHSPSHEEYMLSHSGNGWLRNNLNIQIRRYIEKFCIKRSKKIMVLSRYMEKKANKIHSIPSDKTVINPGGVDLNMFQLPSNRELLKAKWALPDEKIHLFTVRNLEPRMGIENLLKSILILHKKHRNIHLIIGGVGPLKKDLESMIKELGLSDTVTMKGFIPADVLAEYYGAADFFILPTIELEGFGLVTLESMACGTPVLGTPVGGTKEILSAFNPQLLFKDSSPEAVATGIESAINNYFNEQSKYNELRLKCRDYVKKNYSWQRHTKQLKSIINEAMLLK